MHVIRQFLDELPFILPPVHSPSGLLLSQSYPLTNQNLKLSRQRDFDAQSVISAVPSHRSGQSQASAPTNPLMMHPQERAFALSISPHPPTYSHADHPKQGDCCSVTSNTLTTITSNTQPTSSTLNAECRSERNFCPSLKAQSVIGLSELNRLYERYSYSDESSSPTPNPNRSRTDMDHQSFYEHHSEFKNQSVAHQPNTNQIRRDPPSVCSDSPTVPPHDDHRYGLDMEREEDPCNDSLDEIDSKTDIISLEPGQARPTHTPRPPPSCFDEPRVVPRVKYCFSPNYSYL